MNFNPERVLEALLNTAYASEGRRFKVTLTRKDDTDGVDDQCNVCGSHDSDTDTVDSSH